MRGFGYRTINVARSAVSKYHGGVNGVSVGATAMVCLFMKGAFMNNPPVRTLLPSWELSILLEYLQGHPFEPLHRASLGDVTLKTVFLTAITSARRVSELGSLGRVAPYIRWESAGVRLRTVPNFLPKTATPAHLGRDIFLPRFLANRKLCVFRCLKRYLQITEDFIDNSEFHMFVCHGGKRRGKAASKQTISNWIVKVIKNAYEAKGETAPDIKAHSTRGTATSWALFNQASFNAVMQAADWRQKSTFVKHYALDLWKQKDTEFGAAVLATDDTQE